MLHLLIVAVAVLCATPAFAQDGVDFLFTEHAAAEAADMSRGTVSFAIGDVAYFASPDATYAVELTKKKPRITKLDGHPPQAHHKDAQSIELGAAGALVILTDDRRRLKLIRFDARSKTWSNVERPIGFVPREYAVVGQHVVFPQTTRSPAWYTYDITAGAFERVERPRDTTRCYGNTFEDGPTAIVAGLDDDGVPCAVRFDPVKRSWTELPAPPRVPGPRAVKVGASTHLFGPLAETVVYRKGAWSTAGTAPDLDTDAQIGASSRRLIAWAAAKGNITQWVWTTGTKSWKTASEDVAWTPRIAATLSDDRWLVVGTVGGEKALLELTYSAGLTTKRRAENRATIDESHGAPIDWGSASDDEKHDAIKKGLGAVERYVPPERDPSGKVVTKGAWVFALGEELVVWPVPPKQCARFLDRMIAQWPTTTTGTKWKVERGNGFARAGKTVLYSPTAQCRDTSKCTTDFFSERVTPLSQVGPIFSFTRHTNTSACDKTAATERWVAIDLRTSRPASLTAVIKEDSILEALRRHKKLRSVVGEAASLEAARKALWKVDGLAAEGYAFGAWRSATRRVQLRLEFHPESPDLVESINLWVEPKDEFLEIFEEAARTPGSYMSGS